MTAFARYLVAGTTALAVHLAVLEGLLRTSPCPPWAASAAGFVIACYVNYTLQHLWVFRSGRPHAAAAPRYVAVTLAMLGVNTVLFALLHGAGLPPGLAQVATTGGVFLANFVLNRRFTFAHSRPGETARA